MILGASKASGGALIPASNGIGIGIAALGGIMLAFYTLGVKMIGAKGASPETLAILQFLSLGLFMGTGSLAMGEDWSPWLRLAPSGILSFFAFVFGVLLLGTILQNNVLRHIEAAVYSTFQAWRLVATISMSWLILGEGISTLLQVMGALVVIGSVTFYTLANNKKRIQGESAK